MKDEPPVNSEILECPFCRAENPPGADSCSGCGRPVGEGQWLSGTLVYSGTLVDSETIDSPPGDSTDQGPPESPREASVFEAMASPGTLEPGTVLGDRYRIEELLGFGGMGSVYKASDLELDRVVALKVIRPHLADDPNVLQRFKQEIILSREVTHRNVVRIFDIGQADDTRFISMEFVEGTDLHGVLKERGALPAEEAMEIIEQVCLALDAAHQQGVVHRDLKPANIMIVPDGRVVVMDFGIARSLEHSGMTQTGSLLGTPDYMSPEQVKGESVDSRSDLFALGIIFYQLLTGELPYKGETPMAAMYTRTQKRAAPIRDLDPDLPGFLGDVVGRCLEIPIHKRYQSAREVLQDLSVLRGGSTHMTIGPTMRGMLPSTTVARKRVRFATVGAAAAAVVAVVVAGVILFRSFAPSSEGEGVPAAAPTEVVSLAILPFQNASGDPELSWLGPGLAEMLRTDVGQTASLRTVSSDRLHQVLKDLRIAADTPIEEVTLRRIAEFANADTVVWGQFLKLGEQIRIDATIRDFERHETTSLKAEAADEQQLLRAVQELAQGVRDNLALSGKAVKELEEQAFIPSASSVVALRHYNEGLELMRQGNNLEAVKSFEIAVEGDPSFALAYSKLGQAYDNLGRGQKAEESSRHAVELSDNLPSQERYLILAESARVENDFEAGIDAYENLLRSRPTDTGLNYELAVLYEQAGSFDLAREHLQTTLDLDPQNVTAQLAMGRVLIKSGDIQGSLAPLNQALSLAIQVDNKEARANTLQAIGIAYRYLGRPQEALDSYRQSLAIKSEIGDQRGMASSLSEIAYIEAASGNPEEARRSYREGIEISREIGDEAGVGRLLTGLGEVERGEGNLDLALQHTREALRIQMETNDDWNQVQSLNNIGTIYGLRGEYSEALVYFQRALEIREKFEDPNETAEGLHNLAETYTALGRYERAIDHYVRALENRRAAADERGAALESFSLGRVFEYQGRYGAALDSAEEALEILRRLGDDGSWFVEALVVAGGSLSRAGRFEEAATILDEASQRTRDLDDPWLAALTMNAVGDRLLLAGDPSAARARYAEAAGAAAVAGDPYLILTIETNLAGCEVESGSPAAAAPVVERLVEDAQSRGVKYLVARSELLLGQSLAATGDLDRTETQLRRALRAVEEVGATDLIAMAHHLLAETLDSAGNGDDAARHAAKAAEYLEEIRTESGTDAVLERTDLKHITVSP